jgi:tetratricopeptide (TPR) repeat protein
MKTKLPLAAAAALLLALVGHAQTPATPTATPAPDAAALHQQSLESVKQKKFKEAAEFAEQATKADPTKPEYFSQLGVALSQRMGEVNFMQMAALSGRMKKAFEKSIELDPNHVAGLIGLARFHTNAPEIAGGSLVKAEEFAARVQKLEPFLGALELGRVAEKAEKPAEALAHYEAAAKANPKSAGVLAAAGRLLAQAGKKDEARARFEAALKINPEHEVAKKGLAELDKPAS